MGNLEKDEKKDKSNWGGKRDNSGRKPLLNREDLEKVKELISQHGSEVDPLKEKERVLILLDKLYEEGEKGNIAAIKEYFDRQLGKSKESVDITTKGDKLTQRNVIRLSNGTEIPLD